MMGVFAMYKLILVDDEEEVREGIVRKIEWDKIGFEVAGQAENGREALEIAEKTAPDLIITDIKMPFMDGLELSSEIKARFPTTKIIVLTGFDEFEYAQKAIKLNVVEYVLKPVSSQELIDTLIKVKKQIDEEIAQKEDMQSLREYYKSSLPVLKEKFLSLLIMSKLEKSEIQKKSREYGINLDGEGFVVSVVSMDHSVKKLSEDETHSHNGNNRLIELAMMKICDEIVEKYNLGTAFLYNDCVVVITVSGEWGKESVVNVTFSALEEIRQSVSKFLKHTVTIGVGTVCADSIFIYNSYQSAISALDYRLIMGNNRIIWIEDVEPKSINRIVFDELKAHALTSSIKVGTVEEVTQTIDGLFKDIIEMKASFKDYQIYLLEMLTTILKVARDSDIDMSNVLPSNYNLFVELYKFGDIHEVKHWITGICIKVMDFISKDRQNTSKLLVEKAKEYVMCHFHESDITIDKVCMYLHISSTYFSSIFKRETKTTFINYLTQTRMDKARQLLRTTNMKSFEIAAKVGYSEPNYFSYCFKKKYGISPSEYRNNG